jgi:hypothetical protein
LTYLHDELDRADEEAEELEEQVLLLLLHLVETIFPATLDNLLLCETDAGVGLEHVLGDDAGTAGRDIFLLLELEKHQLLAMVAIELKAVRRVRRAAKPDQRRRASIFLGENRRRHSCPIEAN